MSTYFPRGMQPKNYVELRRCRCDHCANVPERKDGRVWQGIVQRVKRNGRCRSKVYAHEAGFDGATLLPTVTVTFEPKEWDSLEKVGS